MIARAYFFLATTAFLWAGNAVAGKLAVGHASPLLLVTLRWLVAVIVIVAIGYRQIARDWPVIRTKLPLLGLMGAVGFTMFNDLFYTAANYTTAINIVIIQAGMPLIIFLANFALFRIRVTGAQWVGFALTLCGVLTVAAQGSLTVLMHLHLNRGDALMLVAIVCYGLYTVWLRWMPNIHMFSFMAALSVAALIASLPFAGYEVASGHAIWPDAQGWAVVVYIGLFPSLLSQMCFAAGTAIIGSNRAGLFVNFVPVFGAVLSVLILGEHLHAYHFAALALVIGGVTLAQRRRRPPAEVSP